ncbi:MAG: NGG1p interacting factor NIF3 [Hahellaceae bacterium]|nr:NGG1p interacting factor NIF3 [Hahellaceae bacterium]
MYKICFFVPESHLEVVKEALFAAGAGRLGDYDHCCWQTLGQGQFRGSSNSHPFIGEPCSIERVSEYKVEMVCEEHLVQVAIDALKQAHPYEEPAYEYFPVNT